MGEEQEKPAEHAIVNAGFRDGRWLVLNNCHLSLEFMAKMEEILNPKGKDHLLRKQGVPTWSSLNGHQGNN
jgi:hypothetical protein